MKRTATLTAIIMVITIIAGIGAPIPTQANPLEDLYSEKLAVSLVIDTSGSMNGTDPGMLRRRVADIFIDMLNPDDYLGIVTFNSGVDLVIEPARMEGEATRTSFKNQIQDRLQGNADTDYTSALAQAQSQLDSIQDPDARKLIIFLTDGRPDPDPVNITSNQQAMEGYMNGLWEGVGSISEKGYPVYSIGFSDGIDVDVLNRIAEETGGDVRIYRDAAELDENLIQILGSREQIIQELLAPAIIQEAIGKPVIQNEFWPQGGGYRIGETETIAASIRVGNRNLGEGPLLQVDSFHFVVEKSNGESSRLQLYDDGVELSGDIMAGDGLWTNRLDISSAYSAKVYLQASGTYREEPFDLDKDLGEIFTAEPGRVILEAEKTDLWVKGGDSLLIPVKVDNRSEFVEVLNFSVEGDLGNLRTNQVELAPGSSRVVNLYIDTESGVSKGSGDLKLAARAIYPETVVQNNNLNYRVETVGFIGNLAKKFQENILMVSILAGVFLVLPLAFVVLGMLFYQILLAPATRIRGTLICWKENESEDKVELNLKEMKKREVIISMDREDKADFNLRSTRYTYDILAGKKLLVEGRKFILGWKKLLSRKPMTSTYIKTTQPGILHFRDEIYTEMNLYDGMEFHSGDYQFRYSMGDAKWSKGEEAGKDILEGRTNGF